VTALGEIEGPGQVGRIVREVGVHLLHGIVASLQSPPEAGDVRGAQAHLARPLQEADLALPPGPMLADAIERAVPAAVVHEQHVGERRVLADAGEQLVDVFHLVVGGNDDQRQRRAGHSSSSPR
jgi:hypothetical protein